MASRAMRNSSSHVGEKARVSIPPIPVPIRKLRLVSIAVYRIPASALRDEGKASANNGHVFHEVNELAGLSPMQVSDQCSNKYEDPQAQRHQFRLIADQHQQTASQLDY